MSSQPFSSPPRRSNGRCRVPGAPIRPGPLSRRCSLMAPVFPPFSDPTAMIEVKASRKRQLFAGDVSTPPLRRVLKAPPPSPADERAPKRESSRIADEMIAAHAAAVLARAVQSEEKVTTQLVELTRQIVQQMGSITNAIESIVAYVNLKEAETESEE